jgi:photosystem II stability/assembly factor-like uncharacterized protein
MKYYKLIIVILFVVVFSTGCIVKVNTSSTGRQGGIFITENSGASWANISRLLSLESSETFLGATISDMIFDPQVSSTIYAGTNSDGIFYTLDGGRGWQQTLSGAGKIYDVAVHPFNKCSIYAATGKQLYRSQDCARTWQAILLETRKDEILSKIAIDDSDVPVLYAGSNLGALHKSIDGGKTWQSLHFFDDGVADIIISPDNYNTIYVGLYNDGLVKSVDRGVSWGSVTDGFVKEYSGFNKYHRLVISESDGSLLYANDFGIAKSRDGGSTWDNLNLLTPPHSIYIYGIAISQSDSQVVYYTSHDTFYKSIDGGENWSTTTMPTSKVFRYLLVSPNSDGIVYVGAANKIK